MKRPALLLSASIAIFASPLLSAQNAEASANPVITADAQAVLDRMAASLNGLKTFSITGDSSRDEVMPLGFTMQNNEHAVLTVQRPDKLRVEMSGDVRNRSFFFDGANLTMYSPEDAAYTRVEAPGTLKTLVGGLLDLGVEMPMIDVLYQGAQGTLTEAVESGFVIGDSTINGIACDQLGFRQDDIDWQLWVQKGATALPLKIAITTRYEYGAPQFQTVMTWNTKPRIDKKTFVFSPPKGATEISFSDPAAFQAPAATGDQP